MIAACLLLLAAPQPPEAPADAVRGALADIRRLDSGLQQRTQYLSLYHLSDPVTLGHWDAVLAFWVNSLSTESELIRPRRVSRGLWAVDRAAYGWKAQVWERLAEVDPYFHVRSLVAAPVEYDTWGYYAGPGNTNWVTTRKVPRAAKSAVVQAASAPWLPTAEIAELIARTQSQIPIVRADWWLYQTAQAKDRKAGYYDWLNLGKKEADFQALVGADPKAATRLKLERAGVVGKSVVTLNNRSMIRQPTLTGAYWATQDYAASQDKQHTLRLLQGDADADASEQYGTLPNGLFAFWLQDGKGNRQDTAPDSIASDGEAPGTDRRVHVGVSCVRCHEQGIRPIDDWARRVFAPPFRLEAVEVERLKKLRSLYLSDLTGAIEDDQNRYAKVLKGLNGLAPETNAGYFARLHERYAEEDRTNADAAAELGLSPQEWDRKLKAAASRDRKLDPVLAALAQGIPVRAEWWEEVFPLAAKIAREP